MGGIPGVLDRLAQRPEPLVRLIERRPGQREDRYIPLLGATNWPADTVTRPGLREEREEREISGPSSRNMHERILALEAETANLRRDLASMRELLDDLLGPNPPPESAPD
jgi:uncharacterized protein YceH (UPF0502 family)